jgi:hypothetical protein
MLPSLSFLEATVAMVVETGTQNAIYYSPCFFTHFRSAEHMLVEHAWTAVSYNGGRCMSLFTGSLVLLIFLNT